MLLTAAAKALEDDQCAAVRLDQALRGTAEERSGSTHRTQQPDAMIDNCARCTITIADLRSTMRACLTRAVLDFDMAGVLTGHHVLPRLSRRRDSASAVGIAPSLQPLGMASSGMVHCRRAASRSSRLFLGSRRLTNRGVASGVNSEAWPRQRQLGDNGPGMP